MLIDVSQLLRKLELAFVKLEEVDKLEDFMRLVELGEELDIFQFVEIFPLDVFKLDDPLYKFGFLGTHLCANFLKQIIWLYPLITFLLERLHNPNHFVFGDPAHFESLQE